MSKDENPFFFVLRMQAFSLLDERHHTAKGEDDGRNRQSNNETDSNIADNEAYYTTSCRSGCPIDITTLETQKFKRPLKPLEHRVILIACYLFHCE